MPHLQGSDNFSTSEWLFLFSQHTGANIDFPLILRLLSHPDPLILQLLSHPETSSARSLKFYMYTNNAADDDVNAAQGLYAHVFIVKTKHSCYTTRVRTLVVHMHVQRMSQNVPKYLPKCSKMAIHHTNIPGLVGWFASIKCPPEWVPDRIQEFFVLLMSQNVPTKKSCMSQNLSKNVSNIVGMSQTGKRTALIIMFVILNVPWPTSPEMVQNWKNVSLEMALSALRHKFN